MSYLLFCLDLQNIKQSILTLDECKVLASQHGIEGDQVSHLLCFLYIRIGVIRYFNIEGLKHIIIKEPQVLFDMITDLLVKTFSCESVTREAFDFKKKGILAASAFEDVVRSDDKIRISSTSCSSPHHQLHSLHQKTRKRSTSYLVS